MTPLNVLISLHRGYGMGDAVQMSAVLRHVVKYRPDWRIDLQAEHGRHCVGRGIVQNTFAFGETPLRDHYDLDVEILLFDTWANWHDRPNTRVSSCLLERFGIEWDRELARYQVEVRYKTQDEVFGLLSSVKFYAERNQEAQVVAVHYQGDSSPEKKNLTHDQALAVCEKIHSLGRIPLLLDWRNKSPLPDDKIQTVGRYDLASIWGGDAEVNCAIISQCAAFVGIDSGPSKCASATETPTLVTWTGHHPAPFHDPAPNTTHLVPRGYHGLQPVCDDLGVIKFFESNYNVRQYDADPVSEIGEWLCTVLK